VDCFDRPACRLLDCPGRWGDLRAGPLRALGVVSVMSAARIIGITVMLALMLSLRNSVDAHFESWWGRSLATGLLAGAGYAIGSAIGWLLMRLHKG
jgi:hypothetical protein